MCLYVEVVCEEYVYGGVCELVCVCIEVVCMVCEVSIVWGVCVRGVCVYVEVAVCVKSVCVGCVVVVCVVCVRNMCVGCVCCGGGCGVCV